MAFAAAFVRLRPCRLQWRHGRRPFPLAHFNSRGILELLEQPPLRRAANYTSGASLALQARRFLPKPFATSSELRDPERAGWPGLWRLATAGAFLGGVGGTEDTLLGAVG